MSAWTPSREVYERMLKTDPITRALVEAIGPGEVIPGPGFDRIDCPECQVGKCQNCDGRTWDEENDDYAPCPCATRGHR